MEGREGREEGREEREDGENGEREGREGRREGRQEREGGRGGRGGEPYIFQHIGGQLDFHQLIQHLNFFSQHALVIDEHRSLIFSENVRNEGVKNI
jgi:hypothetical protein